MLENIKIKNPLCYLKEDFLFFANYVFDIHPN